MSEQGDNTNLADVLDSVTPEEEAAFGVAAGGGAGDDGGDPGASAGDGSQAKDGGADDGAAGGSDAGQPGAADAGKDAGKDAGGDQQPGGQQQAPAYLTKEQVDELLAAQRATLLSDIEERERKIHGKFGEVERELQKRPGLRKVTADQFKRFNEGFDAESLAADLSELLTDSPSDDVLTKFLEERINPALKETHDKAVQQAKAELLLELEFREVKKEWPTIDDDLKPGTPFKKTFDALPEETHREWDAATTAAQMLSVRKQVLANMEADAAAEAERQRKADRLRAAVNPTGGGASDPATRSTEPSEDDAFNEAATAVAKKRGVQ